MQDENKDVSSDKELRHLKRSELIEIIYKMKQNEEILKQELDEANKKLEEREIILEKSGSIAEAALALNGIFEVAQQAADDYVHSVQMTYKNKKKTGCKDAGKRQK